MEQLRKSMRKRWSALGLAARLWWAGLATVGVAAGSCWPPPPSRTRHHTRPRPSAAATKTAGSGAGTTSGSGTGGGAGSMAGMAMGGSSTTFRSVLRVLRHLRRQAAPRRTTSNTVCSNVKGATTMPNGMVMAPVPSGSPTAAPQAAANQLVAETAGHTDQVHLPIRPRRRPATPRPRTRSGYLVHYANWQIAKTDGSDRPTPPS